MPDLSSALIIVKGAQCSDIQSRSLQQEEKRHSENKAEMFFFFFFYRRFNDEVRKLRLSQEGVIMKPKVLFMKGIGKHSDAAIFIQLTYRLPHRLHKIKT